MAYTKYSLTPANNTAAPPDGAPEGMLPSAVNDTMRDMMAQIRDCGDGIRDGTYTMTAPKITGGTITGATFTGNTFSNPIVTGVSTFAAGTVSAPAITTTGDTNTGIFFPAADTIAFAEGGAESMRIDSSGNVGIGTSSPSSYANQTTLTVNGTTYGRVDLANGGTVRGYLYGGSAGITLETGGALPVAFATSGTERMRIDSSGFIRIGDLNQQLGSGSNVLACSGNGYASLRVRRGADSGECVLFYGSSSSSSTVGNIFVSGSATTYNTSSDYRLKENIAPMTGALAKVAQLKPCSWTWKLDGSAGQGFIAHELQEVVPDAVCGEKDAVETVDDVDADGKVIGTKEVPKYQGIDTSLLVATLTAAIQELKAELDATKAEVQALKGV